MAMLRLTAVCVGVFALIAILEAAEGKGNNAESEPIALALSLTNETNVTTSTSATITTSTDETTASESTTNSPASTVSTSESATTKLSTESTTESTTPIVTTPTPTPTPDMDEPGTWNVSFNGTICLKLMMAAQLQYKDANNKTYTVNVPSNATKDDTMSTCGLTEDVLVLNWDFAYDLKLYFDKENGTNGERDKYHLGNLTFVDIEHKVNVHLIQQTGDFLAGHDGSSYKCNSKETAQLSDDATISWKDVQVQAFMKTPDYSNAEVCTQDDKTNDIVPLAVGLALAGLVVIVLIAYIIGRRVNRQKGYQSV